MRSLAVLIFIFVLLWPSSSLLAQRELVLKQIDLPHPYYYREMYLPQLTTGPSGVTWSPDSRELIYSMQGSLWRQAVDSPLAEQLTAGPGYDYQPDWSPDGKQVVFCRYNKDAMSLYLLDLTSKNVRPLFEDGSVSVEPRWSPDGKQIAFVSTLKTGHFHIYLAEIRDSPPLKIRQLTEEHRSDLPRYYYSAFDHEISPTWSSDGSEIIFVSNRGRIHGTGGFWRKKAEPRASAREIRYEETTWKARPDWSPDGKRIVYSSYLGRQWHQLWIMTADGGDPLPLSYGDFDITAPRWSRDGNRIAFISNKDGNTSLWIQDVVGGKQAKITATQKRFLHPMARLKLTVLDAQGHPVAARVSATAEDGRSYAPEDAWIHADDSYTRSERPFEAHYFHTQGRSEILVPPGKIVMDVMKGFEHQFEQQEVQLKADELRSLTVRLRPVPLPAGWRNWLSSDLHIHMNYAGTYRNTPAILAAQAAAEDLDIANNLIVNKEQRIPDISYFSGKTDPASTTKHLLRHDQEFHTSFWGHLGLLGLSRNYLIPDYAAYPNTPAASLHPTNAVVADLAHEQGALVGYVHPFETEPDPEKDERLYEKELPADVALGKVDYLEVLGFSDHKATAAVWYRLLNCGFRIPAGAGTDAMANYASLRGPVGMNRVYVNTRDRSRWLEALRLGRTFATNGPLLTFTMNGQGIGSEVRLKEAQDLKFTSSLRSIVPVDHLQIVFNGNVIKDIELKGKRTAADISSTVPVTQSGWFVLRAWNEKAVYPVLDIYPYATTSPIYVTVDEKPVRSTKDATYFLTWIDRVMREASEHTGYNTQEEKRTTLEMLSQARAVFQKLR